MQENKNDAPTSKVFYRPIEASIRWTGLLRYEQVILASISWPRKGTLHMRHIAMDELVETDIDRYEMVVFDGGNGSGDSWKHVFFPRQRTHCFVYDA